MTSTDHQRRLAHEQALASSRIEGHVPTAAFLADCEAVIAGTMTREEARAASLARALSNDRAARDLAAAEGGVRLISVQKVTVRIASNGAGVPA